jgi:hypothetical protein
MKTYEGWMYRPPFSGSGNYLEVSGQLHAPAALSPGKEPPVPIGLEAGWAPDPGWTTWRSENCFHHRDSNSDPLGESKLEKGRKVERPRLRWLEDVEND